MKKLLMVAGVTSFLALSFSVQGQTIIEEPTRESGMFCDKVTHVDKKGKEKLMERCCIVHSRNDRDKSFHTTTCRLKQLDG